MHAAAISRFQNKLNQLEQKTLIFTNRIKLSFRLAYLYQGVEIKQCNIFLRKCKILDVWF